MSRADVFNKIEWVSSSSLEVLPEGLSWDDLKRAAFLRTGNGRLYEGFYAFRMLSLRIIPLMPLTLVMWLPGAGKVGSAVYRWVARNRHHFARFLGSHDGSLQDK